MMKMYCNGKKDFCPHYDGVREPNCHELNCEHIDNSGVKYIEIPNTNYDRIIHMSVDEMAEFMRKMLDCVSCQNKMMNNNNPLGKEKCNDTDYFKMCNGDYSKCLAVCKKWLESEVE